MPDVMPEAQPEIIQGVNLVAEDGVVYFETGRASLALTPQEARALAAKLIAEADEIDGDAA